MKYKIQFRMLKVLVDFFPISFFDCDFIYGQIFEKNSIYVSFMLYFHIEKFQKIENFDDFFELNLT